MSIIGSNRNRGKSSDGARVCTNANLASSSREPSKAELRAMLEEAVKNTAAIGLEETGQ